MQSPSSTIIPATNNPTTSNIPASATISTTYATQDSIYPNPSISYVPSTSYPAASVSSVSPDPTSSVPSVSSYTGVGIAPETSLLSGKHLTGRRFIRPTTETSYALITGATSGIGLDLARMLVRDNWDVVIVGRSGKKLLDIRKHLLSINPSVSVVNVCTDLAKSNAAETVFQQIQTIPIGILINNAGVGDARPFIEQEHETINNLLNLDVVSYVHLTRLIVPQMVARGYGKVMNIGSIASYIPGPNMTIYYASKAFVLSFSEGLALELKDKNVSVTCLCPGGTRTNWFSASGASTAPLSQPPNLMDSDVVAEKGYAGMMKGKGVVIPGFKNQALVVSSKIMPHGFLSKITRKLNQPRGHEAYNASNSQSLPPPNSTFPPSTY